MPQQMQAQQYGTADQYQYGTDEQLQYSQPGQTIPQQSEELAMGTAFQPGLGGGMETPQLPPAGEEVTEEEPEMPVSPFADAQTQSLEEELGVDAEVAEIPIEPDTAPPEPELAPEEGLPEPGAEPEPETEVSEPGPAEPEAEPKPETEAEDKGEGKAKEAGGKSCPHCGANVKPGWFLCPECKKPLL